MAAQAPDPKARRKQNAQHAAWLASRESRYLARIAARRGAPPGEIADVVQDGLVDFLRSFPGPDDDPTKVRAFAGRCVERRALKRWRRARRKEDQLTTLSELDPGDRGVARREASLADDGSLDPLAAQLSREEAAEARELLGELPADQRMAVVLRAAGYSTEEICDRLGVSERGLRKRITKAHLTLERLRRERDL
jgi:RNA polymerase sigma factor (sigma-70 family)